MHKKNGILGFAVALSLFLVSLPYGHGVDEIRTVTVEGAQEMGQYSRSIAKKKATEDAMKGAVKEVVGSLAEADAIEQNKEALDAKIYERASDFIRNYQPIENRVSQSKIIVKLRAEVWVGPLRQELKSMGLIVENTDTIEAGQVEITFNRPARYQEVVAFRSFLEKNSRDIDWIRTSNLTAKEIRFRVGLRPRSTTRDIMQHIQSGSNGGKNYLAKQIEEGRIQVQ